MQDRVLCAAERQVVDRLERELPVGVVERGREGVEAHGRAEHGRREELHADRHRDQTSAAIGSNRRTRRA